MTKEERINAEYAAIDELQNYLNNTDYKVIREAEGGDPCPESIKTARANARLAIDEHLEEIKRLESVVAESWESVSEQMAEF